MICKCNHYLDRKICWRVSFENRSIFALDFHCRVCSFIKSSRICQFTWESFFFLVRFCFCLLMITTFTFKRRWTWNVSYPSHQIKRSQTRNFNKLHETINSSRNKRNILRDVHVKRNTEKNIKEESRHENRNKRELKWQGVSASVEVMQQMEKRFQERISLTHSQCMHCIIITRVAAVLPSSSTGIRPCNSLNYLLPKMIKIENEIELKHIYRL